MGIYDIFSAIPDLAKMGYEILVFSFITFNLDAVMENLPEVENLAHSWAKSHPEIIFDSRAEGRGMDALNISVHKNYSAYKIFVEQSKTVWGKFMTEVNFILVDLKGGINKPFFFKYLTKEKET